MKEIKISSLKQHHKNRKIHKYQCDRKQRTEKSKAIFNEGNDAKAERQAYQRHNIANNTPFPEPGQYTLHDTR
jgi:hypothetical protein